MFFLTGYPWYEIKSHYEKLSQGDLIFDLIVPSPQYDETSAYFLKTGYKKRDVILMTQSCDLEQEKVTHVKVCGLVPLSDYVTSELIKSELESRQQRAKNAGTTIDESPLQFDYEKSGTKKKIDSILTKLKTGSFLDLYLLNEHYNMPEMSSYIVNLREEYTLPLQSLKAHIYKTQRDRLSLSPPYREHLNQAFVNLYSRIGLPQDIQTSLLKLELADSFEFSEWKHIIKS